MTARKKQEQERSLVLLGILKDLFLEGGVAGNTKRPDMGGLKKFPRGQGSEPKIRS
jgi:hypothetical protein